MTILTEAQRSEPVVMTGQRYIAETLNQYGVTTVFLVPTILTPALAIMGEFGMTRVTAHSEKSAAYMADGYSRASRKVGICMAQTVGAANLAAGLKDAFLAGSPVLAISGGSAPDTRYRHAYQELKDDFLMFDQVTKFSARVEALDRLPDLLRQAFRSATTGAPGPVHLEIAGEQGFVANQEGPLHVFAEPRYSQAPAFRPAAEEADVEAVLGLLQHAERPLIVAGGGVPASGAQAALLALAELLQIPFVTSLTGKSGLPDNHPLHVGVVGSYSRTCANKLVMESDLLFYVGSDTGGQVTGNWKIPPLGTRIVQLDINPEELGRNYPNLASLLGDARTVLQQLHAAGGRPQTNASRRAWTQRAQEAKAEWRAELDKELGADAEVMRPDRFIRELSDVLPEDAFVVVDTGHAGMWTGQVLELCAPSQTYLRAAGSLGWAFPATLGVKCAFPDRPAICFTGDGGFFYHATELETAARYGINAIIMVNNNFSLNQDMRPFNAAYNGNQTEGFEMWQFSGETDLVKMAESMGCVGIRVDQPYELKGAMVRALTANRPVVIDVRTDINVLAPRAWLGGVDVPLRAGAGY